MPRVHDNVYGRPLLMKIGADGKGYLRCVATTGVTINYPYRIIADDNGWCTGGYANVASTSVKKFYIGIATETVTTAAVTELQVMGYHEGILNTTVVGTTGYSLQHVYNTTTITAPGAYSGLAGEFAVIRATSTLASTSHKIMLLGMPIIHVAT